MTVAREIFVCVKAAVTVAGMLKLAPGDAALDPSCRRVVRNEADAFALEAALALRERGEAGRVVCVLAGPDTGGEALALALAMGADRAVRIDVPEDAPLDPAATGALLATALRRLGARLVFAAQRSDDGRSGVVPAALAHHLGAAYLSNAAAVRLDGDGVEIERKLERGDRETWTAALPAVVAFEPGVNVPRYVSVASLVLARRAPQETVSPEDLGVTLEGLPRLTTRLRLAAPRVRPKKLGAMAAGQSTAERLSQIMSGGVTAKKEKKVLKGAPADLAAEVLRLLRERNLLGGSGGDAS